MNRIITFEIWGEYFSPKKIDFKFNNQNERGELHTSKPLVGKVKEYGSATYIVPHKISDKFKHLADTFESMLPELIANGATKWHIYIGRIYYAQCNEELYHNDIKNISRLKCSLAYSAFNVNSEDEEEKGFDYENYCQ